MRFVLTGLALATLGASLAAQLSFTPAQDLPDGQRQAFVRARISQLRERLSVLGSMSLDQIPHGKVGLGSTVSVRQEDNGQEKVYEIVVPEDSDPSIGRISPSSPIGKSLLGNEEGDVVEIRVPSGTREYEITRLVTIHDQVKDDE